MGVGGQTETETERESDRYLILKDKDLGRNLVYTNRESDRYLILKDRFGQEPSLHKQRE